MAAAFYIRFHAIFSKIYEASFPLTKLNTTRKTTPRKPWMTAGLVRSCITKEKLYKRQITCPTEANTTAYKNYSNKLNKTIRVAEKNYYADQFETYKSSSKNTWSIIKQILDKTSESQLVECFKYVDDDITDKEVIVHKFNEYFDNIGPTLANKIPLMSDNCSKYLTGTYKNSFSLYLTTPVEILQVVNSMHPKKAQDMTTYRLRL